MKILLALPHDPTTDVSMPDLGVGYLASSLIAAGHSVDLSIRRSELISPEFFAERHYDVVGVKILSPGFQYAVQTIEAVKKSGTETTIVVGGPHVSGVPEKVFSHFTDASFGVRGEGEGTLVKLVELLERGDASSKDFSDVENLIWHDGEETIVNKQSFVDDLDTLPFPAWQLMKPSSFPPMPFNAYSRNHPIAPVLTSRGCPYQCTFCGNVKVNGRLLRKRSAENIINELLLLKSEYGVREIQFWDDNCTHQKGSLRQVLRYMVDNQMNLSWSAPNGIRLDTVDAVLPPLMKASGCFQVNVGIESGSLRILKKIKKGVTPEIVREKVPLLRKAGIEVIGFFMIGFPGETAQEIKNTISLAMEVPINGASFAIYNPLPGTELAKEIGNHDEDRPDVYNNLDYIRYPNNLSEVTYDELRKIQRNTYLKFHLRPVPIISNLKNLNNLYKLVLIFMRIKKLVFNRF